MDPHDMNGVPLKEYIEKLIAERDKALAAAHASMEARLELLNELRSDVMSRGEFARAHETLVERVRQVELSSTKNAALVSLATSIVVGVVIFVISHYIGKT
jgi:hypothetical protein